MSDRQIFGVENIPPSERLIGSDPLWKDDPAARAAYSSNPGFTEGADTLAIEGQPHDLVLAQPEIVEALEEVYLKQHSKAERQGEPISTELAVPGLAWLREHLDKKSPMLRTVKRAHGILEPQEVLRQDMERRREEEAAKHRAERQAQQAETEAQRTHEAECAQQFEHTLAIAQERYPEIHFSDVVKLAGRLSSRKEPDGSVAIDKTKGFQKAIMRRMGTYLATPQALAEDFSAINTLLLVADEEFQDTSDTVNPRVQTIGTSLAAELDAHSYNDFSEEIMDRWLKIFDGEPAELTDSLSNLQANETIPETPVPFSMNILSNSLSALSTRQPRQFLDRLYTFANKGLQPANRAQFQLTCDIITTCLCRPLAYRELLHATSAALLLDVKDEILQRAVDLTATLDAMGLFERPESDNGFKGLRSEEAALLDEIYPRSLLVASGLVGSMVRTGEDKFLKTTMQDFRKRALTPEGRSTTLYGSLVSQGRIIPRRPSA